MVGGPKQLPNILVEISVKTGHVFDLRVISRVDMDFYLYPGIKKSSSIVSFVPQTCFWDQGNVLQAWISRWFLRIVWVLVKREFSKVESSWIFQFHALIVAETGGSKSLCTLRAGLDSLEAQVSWPRPAWPLAQQLPLIGLCSQKECGGA